MELQPAECRKDVLSLLRREERSAGERQRGMHGVEEERKVKENAFRAGYPGSALRAFLVWIVGEGDSHHLYQHPHVLTGHFDEP